MTSRMTWNLASGILGAAIDEYHYDQSTPAGALTNLAGVWPHGTCAGDEMEEATSALAEARRLNPQLPLKCGANPIR